ncbi:unnamed protein product [Brassica napus]|uniref:(rape) hypothetical protein n=1 Tax=Brassica napus TaxID=3708 RepID=A0A816LJ16_BRANA|nr:unnamed protein product [Brassica napus]
MKTFNEFFIRELKPGARTMAYMNRDDVAGRKFSIRGLLGKNVNRNAFLDGSLDMGFGPETVTPKYCNEFTENNRTLAIISTSEFGKVHFTQNPLSLHAALEVG